MERLNFKTGMDYINAERTEQIEKHGRTIDHDKQYNNRQLIDAAEYCLCFSGHGDCNSEYPKDWSVDFKMKIRSNSKLKNLITAGSLYKAHSQAFGESIRVMGKLNKIAKYIEDLIHDNPELINNK